MLAEVVYRISGRACTAASSVDAPSGEQITVLLPLQVPDIWH
jgi:hypothetical protein